MTGKKTLFNVGYYKKGGVFTGSDAGMRYRVEKTGDGVLTAWAWPEPFAFAETPDERKVTFEAELSDEAEHTAGGGLKGTRFLSESAIMYRVYCIVFNRNSIYILIERNEDL